MKEKAKTLRDEVVSIDQQILRLLLKRHNLLAKMRGKDRLDPGEEKFLREAWQNDVARVSKDPELSGRFFSLMQNVGFLPRPENNGDQGFRKRESFNLAPPRRPVRIAMTCPVDSRQSRFWLYFAACSGQPLKIGPAVQSDALVDFVQALNQMGASITRQEADLAVRAYAPMGSPDKVFYVGDSELDFYICLAHYLGRPSRAKFTGKTRLKLADLSAMHSTLRDLGARLIHIVPKSAGLPARLECSGILPAAITPGPELPAGFIEALLIAAPFYSQPLGMDLRMRQDWRQIISRILPLYEASGVTFTLADKGVNAQPSSIALPSAPPLPVEPVLAAFLLALAAPLGGTVSLKGAWPDEADPLWEAIQRAGLDWHKTGVELNVHARAPIKRFNLPAIPDNLPAEAIPLLAGLAACAALLDGEATLPEYILNSPDVTDFFHVIGLESQGGAILKGSGSSPVWNAPTPQWALALALAACARGKREGFGLGNPGIVTEIWPSFWALYNSLPEPLIKKKQEPAAVPPKRRRVLTDAVAVPPEMKED